MYRSTEQPFLPVYRGTSKIANPSALAVRLSCSVSHSLN